MLIRTGIVILGIIFLIFQAAVFSIMKDAAEGNKKLFWRWASTWIAVNILTVATIYWIATGTLFGLEL